jgi:long-subunit fatty acid transport protein
LGQSAFIAVADDATAASWNPAGLINLEKREASFVGIWKTHTNDLSSNNSDQLLEGDSWNVDEINFMSYAEPIEIDNSNIVLSVNYHQVYDLGFEYGLSATKSSEETKSKGAISAYSIAGGLSLPSYPQIAVGGSFNWYNHSIQSGCIRRTEKRKWTYRTNRRTGEVRTTVSGSNETLDDLSGYNFTFGFIWDLYEREENLLTLGLVYHTPYTAKVDQEVVRIEDGSETPPEPTNSLDIDFPLSLGAGVNYRFSDEFSAAFDVQRIDWSEFTYTGAVNPPNEDVLAYRLGFEQLDLPEVAEEPVFALRGGAFYEPRPAWEEILPVYGLSAGLGWTFRERISIDFAYQYRWGEEELMMNDVNFDYTIEEQIFVASIIIYSK